MDKNFRAFIRFSLTLIFVLLIILSTVVYVFLNSSLKTYNIITTFLLAGVSAAFFVFLTAFIIVFFVYKNKRINKYLKSPVKFLAKLVFPLIITISGIVTGKKDAVRNFYITINNLLVDSEKILYEREKILILLPHCLQSTECSFKITNNISNCKKCGKCSIGRIAEISEKTGVKAFVATGGTAARNVIEQERPELVISVACERDLVSGIEDVAKINVYGILNERPQGPCRNTRVDVNEIERVLSENMKK